MTKNTGRKSYFESLPSYLAGFAAVATATVAVLTYLHNRDVAPGNQQETNLITEPEVNREHVGAVPAVEVAPTRAGNAPAKISPVGGAAGRSTAQTTPTLESATRPTRCASYVGAWKLSSGEQMSLFDNDRVEIRAGATAAPRFGKWACSGRNEELFYLTLDRAPTLVFDASGDGNQIYQRADQHTATPLSATRASGQ